MKLPSLQCDVTVAHCLWLHQIFEIAFQSDSLMEGEWEHTVDSYQVVAKHQMVDSLVINDYIFRIFTASTFWAGPLYVTIRNVECKVITDTVWSKQTKEENADKMIPRFGRLTTCLHSLCSLAIDLDWPLCLNDVPCPVDVPYFLFDMFNGSICRFKWT